MTTIYRKAIFDYLCEAVDEARAKAAASPAWLARIDQAWGWMLEQERYEIADLRGHLAVCIPSADYDKNGIVYRANGACQCTAYHLDTPCWHRAASKLLRNALSRKADAEWKARTSYIAAQVLTDELFA
jgi:hypothetical protein